MDVSVPGSCQVLLHENHIRSDDRRGVVNVQHTIRDPVASHVGLDRLGGGVYLVEKVVI